MPSTQIIAPTPSPPPPPAAPGAAATLADRLRRAGLPDFLFQLGLLLGAGLFFHESLGSPWARNLFGALAALIALLITTTLVFQWRVLGDWRRHTNIALYLGLVVVLTYPIAAAVNPQPTGNSLLAVIERPLLEFTATLRRIPGMGTALDVLRGVLSFLFILATIITLLIGTGPGRTGALLFIAGLMAAICLFFHPAAETIVAFLLLGTFIYHQWEIPLIIPPRIHQFLRPVQLAYLRELLRAGALTTGETRLLLDNNPNHYAELQELQLVTYDPIAREITPGPKLTHDPASAAVTSLFAIMRRGAWILLGVLYFLLPDLIPGPIDDIIVMALCTGSGLSLTSIFTRRRRV
jgi:hypothetical protein